MSIDNKPLRRIETDAERLTDIERRLMDLEARPTRVFPNGSRVRPGIALDGNVPGTVGFYRPSGSSALGIVASNAKELLRIGGTVHPSINAGVLIKDDGSILISTDGYTESLVIRPFNPEGRAAIVIRDHQGDYVSEWRTTGEFRAPLGTDGLPSIAFLDDPWSGMYGEGNGVVAFSGSGVRTGRLVPGVDGGDLNRGYRYGGAVYYTSSSTFTKGNYPGLRAVRVQCQGAGGGGGGVAATGADERAVSVGGNGGGYAEKFILVGDLASNETVTVGAGGSGGAAGNNAGSRGGDSSFGSHCVGEGGAGGSGGIVSSSSFFTGESASSTVAGGTGDLVIRGGGATVGFSFGTGIRVGFNSQGGGSHLGAATHVVRQGGSATGSSGGLGSHGIPYGGGASGIISRENTLATAGRNGAPGIVIVHLYY